MFCSSSHFVLNKTHYHCLWKKNIHFNNWVSSLSFSTAKKLNSFMEKHTNFNHIHNKNNNNSNIMEVEVEEKEKDYFQYDHNDACKDSRWTARENYEYMLNKPWQRVVDFYSTLVSGAPNISLSSILFPTLHRKLMPEMQSDCDNGGTEEVSEPMGVLKKERGGRWERVTFKIVLSYHGSSFDGWQKQPGLDTVQSSVEKTLGRFVDEMKAEQLKDRGLPVEGTAVVAGRTDKGVTALHQVCSFYTWRKDVKSQDIIDTFGEREQENIRIVSVSEVSRVFHPNFCAKWRRYLYIFPFNNGAEGLEQNSTGERDTENLNHGQTTEDCLKNDGNMFEIRKKPTKFEISKVNELLRQLEGKLLSYKLFARDTKASRSTGPPTECFLFHARAAEARLPSSAQDGEGTKVMCVELVANRFLRKMVRVLVATAIREAAAGAEKDALIKLMDATCRRATAPPAPPEGLCLVDVGYSEFHPTICYI